MIIGLDGHDVASIDQLHRLLSEERIGREAAFTVLETRREAELRLILAERTE